MHAASKVFYRAVVKHLKKHCQLSIPRCLVNCHPGLVISLVRHCHFTALTITGRLVLSMGAKGIPFPPASDYPIDQLTTVHNTLFTIVSEIELFL